MKQTHPFDPIVDARSKVLILGSFPSIKSFEKQFYYAHPRNQFWPVMEALFGVSLKETAERRNFLHEKGIALWDVYGALTRRSGNSSDANLTDLVPNDIPSLLKRHPGIRAVFCTGKKAYDGLKKAYPDLPVPVTQLPSTSPAFAAMGFDEKLRAYECVKSALG